MTNKNTVTVFAHTHWDREWYRTFEEFRLRLIEAVDEIISQLEQNKIKSFYLDGQTVVIDDYLEIYPEKLEKIKKLIKRKKLFVGPWYSLPDEFLVSGESLIRNLLIGIQSAKKLGCKDFIGYMPDSFGHNSNMPPILNSFGLKNTVLWRGSGELKNFFKWQADDGSSVLALNLTEGYFQDIFSKDIPPKEKIVHIKNLIENLKKFAVTDKILIPAGGDHIGIVKDFAPQLKEISKINDDFIVESGSIFKYLKELKYNPDEIETFKGELRDNSRSAILPGTFSTRTYLKKLNAIATHKLCRIAEPLQALTSFAGICPDKRNEIEYAWKLLLQNHAHDSICGCSIDEVHKENVLRFQKVIQISDWISSKCLNEIAKEVHKGDIIFYNASDYEFSGVVKVKTKNELPKNLSAQEISSEKVFPDEILYDLNRAPMMEDMDDFKENLVWVENIKPHSLKIVTPNTKFSGFKEVTVSENRISNSQIQLYVNPDGSINIAILNDGLAFNNINIIESISDVGDTYNSCPVKNDKPLRAKFISSEIHEKGVLRSILRLKYQLEPLDNYIIVDIYLAAGSARAEFEISFVNNLIDRLIRLKFPLKGKITETISENNLGLIKRNIDPEYDIRDFMPAEKNKELRTNTYPMQRFVWAHGLGIITEGLQEYEVNQNELSVTVLRSVGMLSKPYLETRAFPAGPPLEVPEAQCHEKQTFRFALYLTENPVELFREADLFMGSVLTKEGISSEESSLKNTEFFSFDNPNIYVCAVKSPENKKQKGIIIRLLNLSKNTETINLKSELNFSKYIEVNSLECKLHNAKPFDSEIFLKPYEIKSIIIL